jgi:hypothetical protein
LAEAFVADDQKVESWRRSAVFGGIDFFIGAVDTDTENFYEHAAAIRDLVERRLWHVSDVHAVWLSWEYTDGFHFHFSYEFGY